MLNNKHNSKQHNNKHNYNNNRLGCNNSNNNRRNNNSVNNNKFPCTEELLQPTPTEQQAAPTPTCMSPTTRVLLGLRSARQVTHLSQ